MTCKGNIYIGATSLRTCLGDKHQTGEAMEKGESGLIYNNLFTMHTGIADIVPVDGFTRFESIMIEQIESVLEQSGISLSNKDVQLVISTTKGNVDMLADDCEEINDRAFLYRSAEAISAYFNSANSPIVVSNACISGISAFVVAKEFIHSGKCKHVIVAGGDVLCEFITSGFASFKSVSAKPCRPYDAERDGLTLGEAAGAVLLTSDTAFADSALIRLAGGAISNDANHISGPSRTGDGLYYAIRNAMQEAGLTKEDIGFVNAHGTATRYNDEMESKAMAWAELCDKPLNSLKGYIGHTLGASGVVETILCVEQLKLGYIYGTAGFVSSDTPHKLNVSSNRQHITRKCCVKTGSGFGGCNAAVVLDMERRECVVEAPQIVQREPVVAAEYKLEKCSKPFADYIRAQYKLLGDSNIKFYKMSDMSKALYVAVENLLAEEGWGDVEPVRRAIILANSSSSLDADIVHQKILNQNLPEGASPAAFVYTLANVAAGEMCIRHKIQGENTFFIENVDSGFVYEYAGNIIRQDCADAVICGWCDYLKGNWNVNVKLLKLK